MPAVHRPPEPASASDQSFNDPSLAELRVLELEDLLALCARYRHLPERLVRYLEVVRARPEARAQFAAALICFDLARAGVAWAQREFQALGPSLLALTMDEEEEFVGCDAYLKARWGDCRDALSRGDPREFGVADLSVEVIGELDLLAPRDRDALPLTPAEELETASRREKRAQLALLLDAQLGLSPSGSPKGGLPSEGFDTSSGAALDRLERFVRDIEELAPDLETADGLRSLGRLFLATHLRRHTLFGRPNPRRLRAAREGLQLFGAAEQPPVGAASIFEFAGPSIIERFQKVSELLLDFFDWCSRAQMDPGSEAAIDGYLASDRQPPALFADPDPSRRRRR